MGDLERGQWASLLVQVVEHRDGRALVRLPNGSKTSVDPSVLHPMVVEYAVDHSTPADEIGPGDIYEDCSYHPVLCTWRDGDEVAGISLIDGSRLVKLDLAAAVQARDRADRT